MRNGKKLNSCLFGEEFVAYIYDELPSAARETFESHLLDCSGCTADLADISLSRLEVYEWNRDEFVPLETPQFVIPYEPKTVTAPKLSWIDSLRGFLASPVRLATAGGAFAVIAFAFTFGVVFFSGPENQVASVQEQNTETAPVSEVKENQVAGQTVKTSTFDQIKIPATKRQFKSVNNDSRVRPVQINVKRTSPRPKFQTANTQSAPRLGNFVDTEDKSLRLADLVADIDTRD